MKTETPQGLGPSGAEQMKMNALMEWGNDTFLQAKNQAP